VLVEPAEFEPAVFEPFEVEPVLVDPVPFVPVEPVLLEPAPFAPVEFEPFEVEPVLFDPVEFEPVLLVPVEFEPVLFEPVVLAPVVFGWFANWLFAIPGKLRLDARMVPLSIARLTLGPPSIALKTVTRAQPCGIAPISAFTWTALTLFNWVEPTSAIVVQLPALMVTGLASA